jgi:hypothetical protein
VYAHKGGLKVMITQKINKVLAVLLIVPLVFSQLLCSALAHDAKEMSEGKSKVCITYLGSVPLDSSLTDLIPVKDRWSIKYKEKWLYEAVKPERGGLISISLNGKYKVVLSALPGDRGEGTLKATFIDSNDVQIWNAITGDIVFVSNNGRNIASTSIFNGDLYLYDVRGLSEPIAVIPNYGVTLLTKNGEYLMSTGSQISLYKANGNLLWEKDTGAREVGMVAISPDADFIVVSSKSLKAEEDKSEVEVQKAKVKEVTKHREPVAPHETAVPKVKTEREEPSAKKIVQEKKKSESERQHIEKRVRKTYLSFFEKDGTLNNRALIPYRGAQKLAISGDGMYTSMACDSTLLYFKSDGGLLMWKYKFPNAYWMVTSMAISEHGDIIALGINSNRGDRLSVRYLYVLDKAGEKIADFEFEKPTVPQMAPIVTFSEDEKYILVGTKANKYCFEVSKTK